MTLNDILDLPIAELALPESHLYLWVPNALLAEGLEVMRRWGFTYKTNLVWYKIRKDGGPDGRGVGFYFRNVTEIVLFGVRGSLRTLQPGRRQVNIMSSRKREHSRKPDEQYKIIESCSPGPFLELFARHPRVGWSQWGNEIAVTDDEDATEREQFTANVLPFPEEENVAVVNRGGDRIVREVPTPRYTDTGGYNTTPYPIAARGRDS